MDRLKIGFIGLGVMGTPMATHLSKAGHELTLYDRDAPLAQALASSLTDAAGALAGTAGTSVGTAGTLVGTASNLVGSVRSVATPRQVAEHSDIIVTMLPNGQIVREVALGEHGLIHGFKPGSLLLDTSSSEPWLSKETAAALATRGVAMVDAPVSGAQWGAQQADLVFMVGGAPADVERVRPLFDKMGRAVFHLGPLGCGHTMKCINNLITAMTFSATAEGLVLGSQYGLDPKTMVDVLNVSTGQSWISTNHIQQRVVSRSFDDPFKLALMLKDIGIAMQLARDAGLSVPISGLGQQLWSAAAHANSADASVSELARWVENQSGTAIVAKS